MMGIWGGSGFISVTQHKAHYGGAHLLPSCWAENGHRIPPFEGTAPGANIAHFPGAHLRA